MKEIFVYVEGPSDQMGMQRLLSSAIESAAAQGTAVSFIPMNGKEPLLNKGPKKAINILRNRPRSWVFIVPDLYPPNKPFSHTNYVQLKGELEKRFSAEMDRKKCDTRLKQRFKVHCFKYDLEVLLLASEEILLQRLVANKFSRKWKTPVENQNHHLPPKRIVEMLFSNAGKKYKDTADVPWVLERSDFQDLKTKCPQNFAPFVDELFQIIKTG